jgi:hypothetical protein
VVFNYTINDGVSIKPVTAKVTLVVPGSDTAGGVTAVANSFLLLVPADGTANNARCPDPTPGLAEIVNAAVAKIKTVAGLTSVTGAFSKCDLLDQGKVLVTIIYTITAPTAAPINTALAGINSPPVVGTAAAGDNICTSSLLGSLCNGTVFTGLRVTDGCATTAQQCIPQTLRQKRCVVDGPAIGGYTFIRAAGRVAPFVDANAEIIATDGEIAADNGGGRRLLQRVRQATFEACCVSPKQREPPTGTASTCKKINVGKKFTSLSRFKPTTCKCANVREFVQGAM